MPSDKEPPGVSSRVAPSEQTLCQRNHDIYAILLCLSAASLVACFWSATAYWAHNTATSSVVYDWSSIWETIVPSTKLRWVSCYNNRECARFAVPLDYLHPDGPQAAIAVIREPSRYKLGDARYRGPILFNPGGPGNSGVSNLLKIEGMFHKLLGDDYDIVWFDPRGVGFTTPLVQVFNSSEETFSWDVKDKTSQLFSENPSAFARGYARWSVFGDLALQRTRMSAEHASTAMVARDMLSITRAFGFDKLNYWGFSYGSMIGQVFASMFPHNVGRLVLDGVVDAEDHMAGEFNWLHDSEAVMQLFFEACANASPEACALHAASPVAIKARYNGILAMLQSRPLPVFSHCTTSNPSKTYGLVDYRLVRDLVFAFIYWPYGPLPRTTAQSLASALAAAEGGDGRPLWDLAGSSGPQSDCDCSSKRRPSSPSGRSIAAGAAIACGEANVVDNSFQELHARFTKAYNISTFVEVLYFRLFCSGWKLRAKERFEGPFVGNTSFPILFIGNTADPVTSIVNARKMAAGFKDAVVLHRKAAGHMSVSSVSLCTTKTVRNYFRHGTLPVGPEAECEIESRMFGPPASSVTQLSDEDLELWQAAHELQAAFGPSENQWI